MLTIPNNDGTSQNLVTDYGQLTMANVATHATTYTGQHSQDT